MLKKLLPKAMSILALSVFYILIYKLLIPRLTAFGCMDDCNNFMGGYFLLHGKVMFSQIFFNHAPFMAHISELIFWIAKPQNLYEIILRHRQFVLLFGFLAEALLIVRFGWVVLPFALVYELTKFYLAGDRFLAEGLIVYPLVYMGGVVYEKIFKKHVLRLDYFVVAISLWFVVFIREPYAPLALLLFVSLLWNKKEWSIKRWAVAFFFVSLLLTLFSYNVKEFFYNVFYVNQTTIAAENADSGVFGVNLYKTILYPIIIFFQGEWNFIRYVEMGLSAVFLFVNAIFLWKKQWKWILYLWIVLAISNIRLVRPGHEFYGAFHLLPWYSLTIFMTLLMLKKIWNWQKAFGVIGYIGIFVIICYVLFSKGSYVYDKIDEQTEYITNYGNVLQVGNVVNALSNPSQTLFLDGSDDAIYLVAKRYSPYQYSWYTSLMPQYEKYTKARNEMFAENPPDFYYIACRGEKDVKGIPLVVEHSYTRLYNLKDLSCLWVKNSVISSITAAQWQKAGESLFFLRPASH